MFFKIYMVYYYILFIYILGDQCPMYFDDGANPWIHSDNYIQVFKYGRSSTLIVSSSLLSVTVIFTILL